MPKTLSIVIPTYNRRDVLSKALDAYLYQSAINRISELIVVDDGSTDDTRAMVEAFTSKAPFPVRYLHQPNHGPAAARNYGIRESRSDLILFTDSDILPHRDLIAQHITCHDRNPENHIAVLGYVTWPEDIQPTPFMRWYGEDKLFVFNRLRGRTEADFECFYTCNLSLKTNFLRSNGLFDESFVTAAYEDTELGYRLGKAGMRLFYNPSAIGYHYQFFSFEDACRKARSNRAAAQLFFSKESGQTLLKTSQQRRTRLLNRLTRTVAAITATLLYPTRRLLDSRVPMPRLLYHLFYWHDATRRTIFADTERPA